MKGKKIIFIPQINLLNGSCPFCYNFFHYYDHLIKCDKETPVNLCLLLQKGNAKSLLIKDMDSFVGNDNTKSLQTIIFIAQELDILISVYSKFKNVDECRKLLDNKVYKVVIDNLLIKDNNGVSELIQEYTDNRVTINVETVAQDVVFDALSYKIQINDCLKMIESLNIRRILYYEREWSKKEYIQLYNLKLIYERFKFNITLSGGINNSKQLLKLISGETYNIDSIIIGDALFQSKFPCQKIWRFG